MNSIGLSVAFGLDYIGKGVCWFPVVQWSDFGFEAWARLRRFMRVGLFFHGNLGKQSSVSVTWAILC